MSAATRDSIEAYAAEVVASWPPLTEQQRERIAALLRPTRRRDGT